MLDADWPYLAAKAPTPRYPEVGMPCSTEALSEASFCIFSTNDTVTGVSAGVFPNTDAPGTSAALMPEGTCVGAFGLVLEAADAPEATANGTISAPAPSSTPAVSRAFLILIMSCAPSCCDRDPHG